MSDEKMISCDQIKTRLIKNKICQKQRFSLLELQRFMDVAPKLSQIKTGIKTMKVKEVIIYKILLDMLGSFIRNFKTENSKVYQKQYIPTVLAFYQKISPRDLIKVINTICESLSSFKCTELHVNPEVLQLLYIDVLQLPRNKKLRDFLMQNG